MNGDCNFLALRMVCDFNFMLSDVKPQVTMLFMLVNCLKKLELTLKEYVVHSGEVKHPMCF